MGITIKGTGNYLPPFVATNQDFEQFLDTSDEWITTRTGIKRRHLSNGELAFQIGAKAAKQALENAAISLDQIDMILVCSCSPDFLTPSTACMIGKQLGAADLPCLDLNAACAGFVYALDVAEKYLRSGMQNILIIATEIVSRMVDFTDRTTCVLFGDAAAAVVVSPSDRLYASFLTGKPDAAEKIFTKLPPANTPFTTKPVDYGIPQINDAPAGLLMMEGNEVYKFATAAMPEAVITAAERAGIEVADLDLLIPHQANLRIINTALKKMNLPPEKCYLNIADYGNVSSACIPLGLSLLCEESRLSKGVKIGLVGFGAGLVYGAIVFEW